MEHDVTREFLIFGRPANRVLLVLVWGWSAVGILLPVVGRVLVSFRSCHSAYLPRFPVRWPALLLVPSLTISIPIGIALTLFALVDFVVNIRTDHRWVPLLYLLVVPGLSVVIFYGTLLVLFSIGTVPRIEDSLVVDGTEYVLASCAGFDLEGGDAVLYRCDGKQRSCQALVREMLSVDGIPPSTLRYEDSSLIIDGDWSRDPLIYPLEGED